MAPLQFTVQQAVVDEFLAGRRLVVVGASDDGSNFGNTVYKALKEHGYDVVAVHPTTPTVDGDAAYPDVASVPGDVDGVIVMVPAHAAREVVRETAERGIKRVWLFRGIGGDGAADDESVRLCHELGLVVVPGACPLMFLEPVAWIHRLHRRARRHRHGLDVRVTAAG